MAFDPGTKLKSASGAEIEVIRLIGEGGLGAVYSVFHNHTLRAMKLYKPAALKNPGELCRSLISAVESGSPSPGFIWPLDIVELENHSFGYVLDLRPKGYEEMTSYLTTRVRFASRRAMVQAALEITDLFRNLHNRGYCFHSVSDSNFFIHPQTGKVLAGDVDEIAPEGIRTGICARPRYMAPEIARGESLPGRLTDLHSLAVLLFLLMTNTHPLEGRRFLKNPMAVSEERMLYGSDPVFLLDPENDSNRPVKGIHRNIGTAWPALPDSVQELFRKAFSREALMNPAGRVREGDWKRVLTCWARELEEEEKQNS